ncbi:hypothetical protein CALCODRAFT_194442 [Calocera cornea HHB12733]|uniref:Uncharacterized protein n=1 Tax=Calocera cornea HHB12733 TaxID=1353952 RepID=A0A165HI63_9BASI|nr:hypothetical protein CALCODRAFT_194442 [Calocera cornea HHB12733]
MDFCPRLLSLKSCGYDVYLVHQEHISDTFRSMVEHRRLWQTVCGGTPTQFGTLQGSTVNVSGIQRKPYKPPVVPKPVPVSSDVPPQTGAFASGGRRSFVPTPLMDLFLVYNILCWIDRKCFHLVPKHTYPEKVFTALRQLQQVRMVYLSGPLTSNPVPTFIFILLLPKGEALLKLLRAVDSMSDSRPELKPFRALFYFWIRQAFGRGEGSCRISHLGTQIKPMITRGLLLDENGVLFGSVKDYCNRAAAMGVIEIERQSHLDGSITLKGSIAASWIAFKNISAQRGEGWGHTLQNVTGGEAAAIALINVLRGFTRLELLLLPVLCTQTSSFASTIQVVEGQLNQLAQIVGIVSQQLLQDASDAGLVYDGSISYRGLTTAGSLVVKSFLGALHVGAQ